MEDRSGRGWKARVLSGMLLACMVVVVAFGVISCGGPEYVRVVGVGIGTYYQVTYGDSLGRDARVGIDSILGAVSAQFSVYDSLSVVSQFNRSRGGVYAPGVVGLVREALALHEVSEGYFDPTIGPVVRFWGFDGGEVRELDSLRIRYLRGVSSVGNLVIRGDSLLKLASELTLTLNAIAKGYAVDCISGYLSDMGIRHYLVEVGGEIRSSGRSPRGGAWIVGVEAPVVDALLGSAFTVRLGLGNAALATSGNYRNYVARGGARWGHTIDPITGFPAVNPLLSATVLDSSCMRADALATALMAMGFARAVRLVERLPGTEALLIYHDSTGGESVWYSSGMRDMVLR